MIEISIEQLLNSVPVLKKLSSQKFQAVTAYKIARICREGDKELELFNNARANLIQQYGERTENNQLVQDENGYVHFTPENQIKFSQELENLVKSTIQLNVEKISLGELNNILLTPEDIQLIDCFIA